MEFIALPEEVFIMIIRMLDLKSLHNMYNSCQYARNVFHVNTIIKNWYATRNSMATVKYLNSTFFKDIAGNLQEINLCGVPDLCKTQILPALKRMKNLKTIDVSYTDIDIMDFYDMFHACPTIKNVCLNFLLNGNRIFFKNKALEIIERYQNIFQNMDNIHFVGTFWDLIYSNVAFHFLGKSNLNNLKFSIMQQKIPYSTAVEIEYNGFVKFKQFFVYFMNLEAKYGNYITNHFFLDIKVENFDKIIIVNGATLSEIMVYVTPVFKEFFYENFNIKAKSIAEFEDGLTGNMAFMIFNKQCVKYDNSFFTRLHKLVKDYFPYVFEDNRQSPVPNNYDWYYVSPVVTTELNAKDNQQDMGFKKRRIANANYVLDYDHIFKEKHTVNLSLAFTVNYVNPVSLKSNSDFLSKLTFLSLSGTVRYSVEFFNVLFRCCNNLMTLDVIAPSISPCVSPISRSIPLSKTLKNIRLVDRRFDYKTYFYSLSQCKTLENIHIIDQSSESASLADPSTLFANCKNLYNICIKACITDTKTTEMMRLFNKAKIAQDRPQIKISLCRLLTNDSYGLNYDPSIEVFKIFPIKPGLSFG